MNIIDELFEEGDSRLLGLVQLLRISILEKESKKYFLKIGLDFHVVKDSMQCTYCNGIEDYYYKDNFMFSLECKQDGEKLFFEVKDDSC
jgi:hypothetical protein